MRKIAKRISLIMALAMIVTLIPLSALAASYPALKLEKDDYYSPILGNNYSISRCVGEESLLIFEYPESDKQPYINSAVSSNTAVVTTGLNQDDKYLTDCVNLYFKGTGVAMVTVTDKTGATSIIEVSVFFHEPALNYSNATVATGNSKQLELKYTTKKVKWSSSNKKIAKVSKTGKVKGIKKGTCTITAKSEGKTYKCTIHVVKPRLYFYAAIDEYKTRDNYFIVKMSNYSDKKMVITSGIKVRHDDYKFLDRKLRLKKKVTIKPGKTKYVRFYAKGGNTDTDIFAFALKYKFKFNGKTYQGSVRGDSSKYKSGGKWKESFPQAENRKYNEWRWEY